MDVIDCRGLACPGPVLRAKQALEEAAPGEAIALLVDGEAARENVLRFARGRGAKVKVEETPGGWKLTLAPPGTAAQAGPAPAPQPLGAAVLIASDTLGQGDDKLGAILMEGFVRTLLEQERVPGKLLLMNGGVRLAAQGSPLLPALAALGDRGCEVLACGTCLNYFGLADKLAAGRVSNMLEIQAALLSASSVIRP